MKLYNTKSGLLIEADGTFYMASAAGIDEVLSNGNLKALAEEAIKGEAVTAPLAADILPPVQNQEVWASGVTYYRSRNARMEESKDAGGGDFYDRVYTAERPELFFKALGPRVVGPGSNVRIRKDSKWNVPEPELVLVISTKGDIVGYTIGNDMSSRDIEGENPLYLPQAKVYDQSCALGPCILIGYDSVSKSTAITIEIERRGTVEFTGTTTLAELKRDTKELASYLYRETTFPVGALLFTGTGIVPGDEFTLDHGDIVRITISDIGTLENTVA